MGSDGLTGDQPRPKARLGNWRGIPLSILAFSALHVLLGLWFLLGLFFSRCVDEPPPPDAYLIDGCSASLDLWQTGSAPYFLAIVIAGILSAVGLLRPVRRARTVFLLAMAAFFAFPFVDSLLLIKKYLDTTNAEPRGWITALHHVGVNQFYPRVELFWLVAVAWILAASWFLYASRARNFFRAPSTPAPDT